ncbi:restriction endonuclease subunit S [Aeromonas veronii]
MKPLGEVSVINYGYTESATSDPIGPKFLRITDIQDSGVNWDDVPFCQIDATGLKKFKLAHGDIVFARTGATTGKSFLVINPPEAVFASYLIRLRLQDMSLLPEFVSLYFQSKEYWDAIRAGSSGSAQGGFNASKLAALMIPVPTLPEQQRIVAILDEAFEAIAAARTNAEQNRQNARTLFESYLEAVFNHAWQTGPVVSLSDLATDITDGDHMPPPKSETGVPFITIGNIQKDTQKIDFSNTFKVPHEYFSGLKTNKKPQYGDVLYTVTGSFGIPVLVESNAEFCFQRHIGLVRPKAGISSNWLYYLLMSPQVFKQAKDGATGTAQKTVSLKLLRSFKVPRVMAEQQLEAVMKLDALRVETQRLESLYQRKIAALDELKQSLLQQAFSGQL